MRRNCPKCGRFMKMRRATDRKNTIIRQWWCKKCRIPVVHHRTTIYLRMKAARKIAVLRGL